MVWYRICGSIAWVGASLDVGLDGFCASMVSLSIWFHGRPRLVWVVGLEINFSNHFVDCLDCFSRVETVFRRFRGVSRLELFGLATCLEGAFAEAFVTGLVSSFSFGGIFRSSFDEVSKRGSCAVPWYASYGFSGLLGRGLWGLCSIATVLEQSITNRVCVSSLVAWVGGLFSGGFSCLKKW
ncbi:hypothetical protein Bca52824_049806 [Brassica carinata]|uniref:Transmembrane protein n=1 Tax=Brassica carinata TaxID=52824 RepID=A0A8X7RLL3_BRACI|nr:hypothetical protein Bca52824_049806 [Brassica carinata]